MAQAWGACYGEQALRTDTGAEMLGLFARARNRALRHVAVWLGLLGVTLPLLFDLKLAPALALSVLPLLPWAVPARASRGALWLLLSLWGMLALATLATALTLWLFPGVTADGHGVMPIAQVCLAVPLGASAGFWLFGRLTPREPAQVEQMMRLCALATPLMLGVTAFHQL